MHSRAFGGDLVRSSSCLLDCKGWLCWTGGRVTLEVSGSLSGAAPTSRSGPPMSFSPRTTRWT